MHTIRGFRYLWHTLRDKYKFDYLLPRRVNQDAVENLFGGVRSHGHRNVNPTAESFVHSLKALMLNNLASWKSSGENCEEDDAEVLFDAVKAFIESTPAENVQEVHTTVLYEILPPCKGLPFNVHAYVLTLQCFHALHKSQRRSANEADFTTTFCRE